MTSFSANRPHGAVWVDVGLLMAVLALVAWAAFARPSAPRHRPAVPPSDPDAVWKRSPPEH